MRTVLSKSIGVTKGPHSVSFEIAHGTDRQNCILKTNFPTKEQAKKYLLSNWPTINQRARDAIANGAIKNGKVRIAMI